jgi:hypothetical protein
MRSSIQFGVLKSHERQGPGSVHIKRLVDGGEVVRQQLLRAVRVLGQGEVLVLQVVAHGCRDDGLEESVEGVQGGAGVLTPAPGTLQGGEGERVRGVAGLA